MTGTEARKKVARLLARGWTPTEIAAKLGLRSTDTFRKWQTSDPLPHTARALRALAAKAAK